MNIRKFKILRRKSLLGKFLRLPFTLIPDKTILRILSGPLRWKRWIKGSHNLTVVLGTYERLQSHAFFLSAEKVEVFWDLGAHVGYYSLLFRAGNRTGEIIAFEPVERNAVLFNHHMQLNRISGCTQYTMAVSNEKGTLAFNTAKTTVAGRLSSGGSESVEVIRLSEWVADGKIKIPQLIKMDIEGEEYKVLQDIEMILKNHKPKIFLSTHGREVHQACITFLKRFNYSFKPLDVRDLENCKELFVF